MSWRDRTRRLLPYLIVAATGFLAAYLYVFFFVFPSDLLPNDAKVPNVVGLNPSSVPGTYLSGSMPPPL